MGEAWQLDACLGNTLTSLFNAHLSRGKAIRERRGRPQRSRNETGVPARLAWRECVFLIGQMGTSRGG